MAEGLLHAGAHADPEVTLQRTLVGGDGANRLDDLVGQRRQQRAHHGRDLGRELVPGLEGHIHHRVTNFWVWLVPGCEETHAALT